MFYTNTSNPTNPIDVSFREFTISGTQSLIWPAAGVDGSDTVARVMIITAATSTPILRMPPADNGQKGYTTLIHNLSGSSFAIQDETGGAIDTINTTQVKIVELRDNTTAAGAWLSSTLGATTSEANAAALAGAGLTTITTLLASNIATMSFSSTQSFNSSNRAQTQVWTGGSGEANIDSPENLGNGWWIVYKNLGTGTLTLQPVTGDIDNNSNVVLSIGDSATVYSDGTNLYTVGVGSNSTTSDARLVKNVAGSLDITLSSSDLDNDIMNFIGAIGANLNIIFSNTIKNYWLSNNTTGAYTITATTLSGTGVVIPQSGSLCVTCDGTNIIQANTTSGGSITSITAGTGLNGGTITTTGTISLANTSVIGGAYGDSTHFPTFMVNGQGQLTSASSVALGAAAFEGISGNVVNRGGNLSVDLTANSILVNATGASAGGTSLALSSNTVLGMGSSGSVAALTIDSTLNMGAGAVLTATTATSSQLGVVKPDGTVITVSGAGAITVPNATAAAKGVVQVDGTSITVSSGVISSTNVMTALGIGSIIFGRVITSVTAGTPTSSTNITPSSMTATNNTGTTGLTFAASGDTITGNWNPLVSVNPSGNFGWTWFQRVT